MSENICVINTKSGIGTSSPQISQFSHNCDCIKFIIDKDLKNFALVLISSINGDVSVISEGEYLVKTCNDETKETTVLWYPSREITNESGCVLYQLAAYDAKNENAVWYSKEGRLIVNDSIDTDDFSAKVVGSEPNLITELITGIKSLELDTESKLSKKVDKEEGKGLSANDYTNEEKEKLHNLDSDFKEAKQNLENRITQANDDIASMGVLIEENKGEETYNPESTKSQSGKAVAEALAGLVNSAPETLNTLDELAKALGNDPNFAASIMTLLGKKVDKIEGKVLSSNDFTDEEKAVLYELLENYESITNELGASVYPAIDGKVDKVEYFGLTLIEPYFDENLEEGYTWDKLTFENKPYIEGEEDAMRRVEIYSAEGIDKLLYPKPQRDISAVLKPNTQYNFGETASLNLAFPTVANDGDVIYATFMTGETATALTIDTTNTCDIELIPEINTGYEIFGKFNGSIWIVNYSEYTVSEG